MLALYIVHQKGVLTRGRVPRMYVMQYVPIYTARKLYNVIKCSMPAFFKALCLQITLSLSCMCVSITYFIADSRDKPSSNDEEGHRIPFQSERHFHFQ